MCEGSIALSACVACTRTNHALLCIHRYQEAGEKLAVEGFKLTDELAKQKLTLQVIVVLPY